jgi:hypothetical protein
LPACLLIFVGFNVNNRIFYFYQHSFTYKLALHATRALHGGEVAGADESKKNNNKIKGR